MRVHNKFRNVYGILVLISDMLLIIIGIREAFHFFWFPSTHDRQNERGGRALKQYDSGELLSSTDAPYNGVYASEMRAFRT